MYVKHLDFTNVGPFCEADSDFHPKVNVFTGPNNSGKSTVLWVLGDILVYPFGVPAKLLRQNGPATFNICTDDGVCLTGELPVRRQSRARGGGIENQYWTAVRWADSVKLLEAVGYSKFIPALRRTTDFRSQGPSASLESPDSEPREVNPIERAAVQGSFDFPEIRRVTRRVSEGEPELRRRLSLVSDDPSLVSDEAIIQKIVDLDYRSYLRQNTAMRDIVEKIAQMATEITEGFPITFSGVAEDESGFFPAFETVDGVMPFNTMSQGTQSIIQWLARLIIGYAEYYDFPERLGDEPGVIIVDEIDAHLHPAWQTGIIPTLTNHFPNLQIFCSTHSPLMLAGLGPGQVHLLTRDEENLVQVSRNEQSVAGWSADQILRNFLGVRNPTDRATIRNYDKLEELRAKDELSAEESEEMERLMSAGETPQFAGSASFLINELAREMSNLDDEDASQ
ncbi:MAG: AAA family ATPase [Chloroflexi bacterium]|nr:AAA family ATPase [Chloroflexota bacterium]